MLKSLAYAESCILTATVTPCSFNVPTSSGLLYPTNEISLATLVILNTDQSLSLIPKMGSLDYKFLNLDSGIEKLIPGLQSVAVIFLLHPIMLQVIAM